MKKGFTLVELLVTIVIITLLSGIGLAVNQSFSNTGKMRYYSTLESGILLAGSDYFLDHRDKLPTENFIEKVAISNLVNEKYIEPIKDSEGNTCTTGYVYAYLNNNKYNYEVCLECNDGYKSSGKYCEGAYSAIIEVTARTTSGADYNVLSSYNNTLYTNNENVIVTFKMNKDNFEPKRYDVIEVNNDGAVYTSCNANSEASCYVTIAKSGTYEVRAYDKDNKLIATNQQFNVKISKNGPKYTISGNKRIEISKSECSSNKTTKTMTFKIVKDNINEEYKSVKYCVKRLENSNDCSETVNYISNDSLTINLNLESGAYTLKVIATNHLDEVGSADYDFDVMYNVDLEYGDENKTTGIHKVVKGQNYDYLSTKYSDISALPPTKKAYGISDMEVRWYLATEDYEDSKRIRGTTEVTNNCTYKIKGLMAIPIDKPTTAYCSNPTYNGNVQSLTKTMEHVTFLNKDQTDAGKYTIEAKIDKPNYIWKDDWDFENKTIECSITRANVEFPSCTSKTYTGSSIELFAAHTSGVGYTNSAINGINVDTYKGDLTPDSNHKWADNDSTDARSLSCSITRANVEFPSCTSKTYTGSSIELFAAHTSGVGYTNSAISGTNANTYKGDLTPDSNHKWSDNNSTDARSLSCKITKSQVVLTCSDTCSTWNGKAAKICECTNGCTIKAVYLIKGTGNSRELIKMDSNLTSQSGDYICQYNKINNNYSASDLQNSSNYGTWTSGNSQVSKTGIKCNVGDPSKCK